MRSSKVFVVDLDETLTEGGEARVKERVGSAVRGLKEEDWTTILATGRDRVYLLGRRDLDSLFDAWITEAGISIHIFDRKLHIIHASQRWMKFIEYLKSMNFASPKEHTISIKHQYLRKVKDIAAEWGIKLELLDNKGNIILLPKGVNKASALRKLLEIMEMKDAFVVAVGDSEVDLELLREADYAATVANADEKIKKIADYVAEHENGEGVIEIIQIIRRLRP